MAARAGVFLAVWLFSIRAGETDAGRWMVAWNVGQGSWSTLADEHGCAHFDMGGEFAPWEQVMSLCRSRPNSLRLSHWDWDHLGLIGGSARGLPNLCLASPPAGTGETGRKKRLLASLSRCAEVFPSWRPKTGQRSNEFSRVWIAQGILITGDSPKVKEREWSWTLRSKLETVRIFVVGHHGSRTSTSRELLDRLPAAKMAIVSARFRRYGHPHPSVERDLRMRRIPVLKTEDWGSIAIQLESY